VHYSCSQLVTSVCIFRLLEQLIYLYLLYLDTVFKRAQALNKAPVTIIAVSDGLHVDDNSNVQRRSWTSGLGADTLRPARIAMGPARRTKILLRQIKTAFPMKTGFKLHASGKARQAEINREVTEKKTAVNELHN
jgi:hypothetical protein